MIQYYCNQGKGTDIMITNKKLIKTLEELGWEVETDEKGRIKMLETWSPEGEDIVIEFYEDERKIADVIESLKNEYLHFDVDEHVEELIMSRGMNGVPSSIRALLDDAEAIQEMYKELYDKLLELEGER